MLNCESCEILMTDALYGQLDELLEKKLHEHLDSCEQCHAVMQELANANEQLIAAGVSSGIFSDIPERASLDDIWDRLQPPLNEIDAERFRDLQKWRISPRVATMLAIAASVILFISVTSFDLTNSSTEPEIAANQLVHPELMNYLNRAQVPLLLVANAESENVSVIPIRQSFARNMAFEASLLSTSIDDYSSSGQRKLLRDIEFLLLQIANLDESNMAEGVALLQIYLEQNSVLFKIRLLEMRDQELLI
jgi:hypothetical protein